MQKFCIFFVVENTVLNHHAKWIGDLDKVFENVASKALANEDTLLPTQMFSRLPALATFDVDTNFVSGTQKMFLICSEHFVSATNVSQFAQPKKHHEQQFRNNVSSRAST